MLLLYIQPILPTMTYKSFTRETLKAKMKGESLSFQPCWREQLWKPIRSDMTTLLAHNLVSTVKNTAGGQIWRKKNITVKKNVRLQFGQNQKFLIYKLFRLIFVTSCIEGIFDFSKIEGRFFFLQKKLFSASLFTRSNKTCNILGTASRLLLF